MQTELKEIIKQISSSCERLPHVLPGRSTAVSPSANHPAPTTPHSPHPPTHPHTPASKQTSQAKPHINTQNRSTTANCPDAQAAMPNPISPMNVPTLPLFKFSAPWSNICSTQQHGRATNRHLQFEQDCHALDIREQEQEQPNSCSPN